MRRLIDFIKRAFAPTELIEQRNDLLAERRQLLAENADLQERLMRNFDRGNVTLDRLRTRLQGAVRRADELGGLLNRIQTLITEYGATTNTPEPEKDDPRPWCCPDHPAAEIVPRSIGRFRGELQVALRCSVCERQAEERVSVCTSPDTPER